MVCLWFVRELNNARARVQNVYSKSILLLSLFIRSFLHSYVCSVCCAQSEIQEEILVCLWQRRHFLRLFSALGTVSTSTFTHVYTYQHHSRQGNRNQGMATFDIPRERETTKKVNIRMSQNEKEKEMCELQPIKHRKNGKLINSKRQTNSKHWHMEQEESLKRRQRKCNKCEMTRALTPMQSIACVCVYVSMAKCISNSARDRRVFVFHFFFDSKIEKSHNVSLSFSFCRSPWVRSSRRQQIRPTLWTIHMFFDVVFLLFRHFLSLPMKKREKAKEKSASSLNFVRFHFYFDFIVPQALVIMNSNRIWIRIFDC